MATMMHPKLPLLGILVLVLALWPAPGTAAEVDASKQACTDPETVQCGRGDKLQCCDAATSTCICVRTADTIDCSCQAVSEAAAAVGDSKQPEGRGGWRRRRRCGRWNQSSCGLRRPPLCCFNRSEACICQDRNGRNCACVPDRIWDDWEGGGRGDDGGGGRGGGDRG